MRGETRGRSPQLDEAISWSDTLKQATEQLSTYRRRENRDHEDSDFSSIAGIPARCLNIAKVAGMKTKAYNTMPLNIFFQ
jgi:hypothetical protein